MEPKTHVIEQHNFKVQAWKTRYCEDTERLWDECPGLLIKQYVSWVRINNISLWVKVLRKNYKWLEWFGTYTSIAFDSKTQSIDCLKSIFTPQRAPEARDFDVIFFGALHKCRILAAFVNYWKCSDQLRSSALLHRCNHGPGTQVNRYYP